MSHQFFERLARAVLARRGLTAVLLAVVVAVLLSGTAQLQVDFSAQAFFGSDDPEVAFMEGYRERWGRDDDTVAVVIDGQGSSLLTPERLAVLDALAQAVDDHGATGRVSGLTRSQRLKRPAPGIFLPVPLLHTVPGEPDRLAAWQQGVVEDPGLHPTLISASGQHTAILAELSINGDDISEVRGAVTELEELIAAFQGQEGVRAMLAGVPAVRAGLMDVLVRDQLFFVPLAATIMVVVLLILFRSVHGVTVPLMAAALPAGLIFGLMGWMGEPIGLINQTYFTLIPVIAVADAIHMVTRFHEEQQRKGRHEAVVAAMTHVGTACLLTSVTTVVGFASLNMANMPVLRSFGTYAAIGIGFAYLSVLLVAPLGLSLTSAKPRVEKAGAIDRALVACARLSIRWPRAVLGVTALVLVGSLWMGSRTEVNNWLTGILPPAHSTSDGNRIVDEHLGGLLAAEVELAGPVTRQPALVALHRAEHRVVAEVEPIRASLSPASALALASHAVGGSGEVPDSQAAVDRLLEDGRVSELVQGDLARLTFRSQDVGANRFEGVVSEIQRILDEELAGTGLTTHVTGTGSVAYRGINRVTEDLRRSLATAFIIIAVLITVLLRSPRMGLLSLLPNGVPLVVGYGLMGLMKWDLDTAPSVVFTVALGIAVDDTIHLLARYREERRLGETIHTAIETAVRRSGRAVLVTSVILSAGFSTNTFSSFPTNKIFGALGATVILAALLCDLFVLPALLTLWGEPPSVRADQAKA